jgi:hypothetical protein
LCDVSPFCRSDPSGMEGTHGQLCTRFPNRLGSHDANSFADFDWFACGQVTAIALHTDAIVDLQVNTFLMLDFFDAGFDDATLP